MPTIEAIETIAAPSIEKTSNDEGLSDAIALRLNSKDRFSFNEMLAVLGIQKNEKGGIGAQKQTQFEYVKQRIFEQTGEIWEWEGTPKDGYWVRGNDTNIAAPSIEKSLPDEGLSDAIAATDKPKEMEVKEAYKLACDRGCEDKFATFKNYRTKEDDYYAKFGLGRRANPVPEAKTKWFFFDTKS